MILTMKKMTACIGVLAFAALIPFAKADPVNLVAYGGFEGNEDSFEVIQPTAAWNPTQGAEVVSFSDNQTHTGKFSLKFQSEGDSAGMKKARQDVKLNKALNYQIDFYIFGGELSGPEGFGFSLGKYALKDLKSEASVTNDEWTHFFLDGITGIGDPGTITFSFNGERSIFLDDVSVICTSDPEACKAAIPDPTNVPEPGTLLLVGAALAAAGVTARRRKQA